jgi:hypothetical protein
MLRTKLPTAKQFLKYANLSNIKGAERKASESPDEEKLQSRVKKIATPKILSRFSTVSDIIKNSPIIREKRITEEELLEKRTALLKYISPGQSEKGKSDDGSSEKEQKKSREDDLLKGVNFDKLLKKKQEELKVPPSPYILNPHAVRQNFNQSSISINVCSINSFFYRGKCNLLPMWT